MKNRYVNIFIKITLAFCISLGIILFFVRKESLNSSTYSKSLEKNNAYEIIPELTLEHLPDSFKSQNDNGIILAIQELFFGAETNDVDSSKIVKQTSEENMNNFVYWADKKEKNLEIYFPRTQLEKEFESGPLVSALDLVLIFNLQTTIDTFPDCSNTEIEEMLKNGISITNLTCIPDELKPIFKDIFYRMKKDPTNANIVNIILEQNNLDYLKDQNELNTILKNETNQNTQNTVGNNLNRIHSTYQLTQIIPWVLILLPIVLFIFISRGKYLKNFIVEISQLFLAVGLLIILLSNLLNLILNNYLNRWFTHSGIYNGFAMLININDERFITLYKNFFKDIANSLFSSALPTGIIILTISILFLIVIYFTNYADSKKQTTENIPNPQ